MNKTLLESGKYYHIYNRGNNGQNIFFEPENYTFFLHRFHQYISPFCDTIAWVLLKNHFHILIYVKPVEEINSENWNILQLKPLRRQTFICSLDISSIHMLKPSISDIKEPEVCLKKTLKEKRFLLQPILKNLFITSISIL